MKNRDPIYKTCQQSYRHSQFCLGFSCPTAKGLMKKMILPGEVVYGTMAIKIFCVQTGEV